MLGFDVLTIANEGKAVVICPGDAAHDLCAVIRSHPLGREAAVIGTVAQSTAPMVVCKTTGGGRRIIDMPTGENLPRIC
jgi:hydrogenase expression/formation protein HypE